MAFKNDKMNVPKAPALGLLLLEPVFTGYNKRLDNKGFDRPHIDFSSCRVCFFYNSRRK